MSYSASSLRGCKATQKETGQAKEDFDLSCLSEPGWNVFKPVEG
jgi:hypothetical protein